MKIIHRIVISLLIIVFTTSSFDYPFVQAQSTPPVLLKDINNVPFASDPVGFYPWNGTLYFGAKDTLYGRELWRSDGTQAGTWMVKDINPGGQSGMNYPTHGIASFGSLSKTLFFAASDGDIGSGHGSELWKSDGTEAGTVLVKDINPVGDSTPKYFSTANGLVFFLADDGGGARIWQSDGTPDGTLKVSDLPVGLGGNDPSILAAYGGFLYFDGCTTDTGCELWRTDGTPGGTALVMDINPTGDSYPKNMKVVNGMLYFAAADGQNGIELWKSTGNNAELVKDINPGSADSNPTLFTEFGGKVYFAATTANEGTELWRTDGSGAGTELVADINPGASSSIDSYFNNLMAVVGTTLFLTANDNIHGMELWKTDGKNLDLVADINPGINSSKPQFLIPMNGTLYFTAHNLPGDVNQTNNEELWQSDGSAAGTHMVKDITPGSDSTWDIEELEVYNNHLYFNAKTQLWSSDGSEAGTHNGFTINHSTGSAQINLVTPFGNRLFFSANDGVHGNEPWITDGTAQGTRMIKDVAPGSGNGAYGYSAMGPFPAVIGNLLFFIGQAPDSQGYLAPNLWVTDGTEAGTRALTEPGAKPRQWIVKNNELFFFIGGYFSRMDLMKTNGTPSGTVLVKRWEANYNIGYSGISIYNGLIYFHIYQANQPEEFWQTDGSALGTNNAVMTPQVKAIYNQSGSIMPDGSIIYWGNDGKLWQMDMTDTKDSLISGSYQEGYGSQLVSGNWLYFTAEAAGQPGTRNLYRTQGASDSVELLAEGVHWLETKVNNHVYFSIYESPGALWLERIDNDWNIPKLLKPTIGTYHYQVMFSAIVELYGKTFFISDAPGATTELWVSDGTPEGTQMVCDLGLDVTNSPLSFLTALNGRLVFVANDGIHDREWSVYSELTKFMFLPMVKR